MLLSSMEPGEKKKTDFFFPDPDLINHNSLSSMAIQTSQETERVQWIYLEGHMT